MSGCPAPLPGPAAPGTMTCPSVIAFSGSEHPEPASVQALDTKVTQTFGKSPKPG